MCFIVRVIVVGDSTDSVEVYLKWYSCLQNSDKPFYCPHWRINNYETQLNNMKSTIYSHQQRVISLESQASNLQQPIVAINNDQSQMNTDGIVNQTTTPTIPSITGIVNTFSCFNFSQ